MFEKKVTEETKGKGAKKAQEKDANKENTDRKMAGGKSAVGKGTKALSVVKTLVIPAILAAIVVCVIYVALETRAEQAELKTSVVCLKEDVSANTYVTKDDIEKYFTVETVDMTAVPSTAVKSLGDLSKDGFYIEDAMVKNQMVLEDNIAGKDEVMDKYLAGYQVTSFATSSFDSSVNGDLRQGDIVDVYALNPATESLELMAENVYISQSYDSSGNKVTLDSEIAISFTVYVTADEVDRLNTAITYGGIQMYLKTE